MKNESESLLKIIAQELQNTDTVSNEVVLYDAELLDSGWDRRTLERALGKLQTDKVLKSVDVRYAPSSPQPTTPIHARFVSPQTSEYNRAVYVLEVNREKIPSQKAELQISILKTREVVLNDKFILSRPWFDSENHQFIEFALSHANSVITRKALHDAGLRVDKKFAQVIADLGFKGKLTQLKHLFFPNISANSVEFRNPITSADLKFLGVSKENIFSLLKTVPPALGVRERE